MAARSPADVPSVVASARLWNRGPAASSATAAMPRAILCIASSLRIDLLLLAKLETRHGAIQQCLAKGQCDVSAAVPEKRGTFQDNSSRSVQLQFIISIRVPT